MQSAPLSRRTRFRQMVQTHANYVRSVVARSGVHPADVDDTAQRVFLTAHRRFLDILPHAERQFLYVVAKREAGHTTRCYRRSLELADAEPAAVDPYSTRPDELMLRKQALGTLGTALDALDADLLRVYRLCRVEGRSARQVATELGLPLGTVKTRLRRACEQLETRTARMRRTRIG